MAKHERRLRDSEATVFFGSGTSFNGLLRFEEALCIQGKFTGTIEAKGSLIVDRGAVVEADHISVTSLTVFGTVIGEVHALDKIDMMSGAEVRGDMTSVRLRIADGVLFEGQCYMTNVEKEVEIFSRPTEEIKTELQRLND
ncbi:MAG: polymer-forming cytoskeletal protein [Treponema sp.]|jgi:cytoskeletal protein CcmA (bactofilin family)|nr:polymer-forming cytoskeletal protein [Treponema sp.]